jgi:hypothetical protein
MLNTRVKSRETSNQESPMVRSQVSAMGSEFVVQVGAESISVSGSLDAGWSVATEGLPNSYRYRSLDELVFALINLSVAQDGQA